MARDPKQELCDEVGHDLRVLAEILSRRQLSPVGYRALENASYALRQNRTGTEVLRAELTDIDLYIGGSIRFKPSSVQLDRRLIVDIIFEQSLDMACNGDVLGSIRNNSVNFTLKAEKVGARTRKQLISAWHFDLHKYGAAPVGACHPKYHWQFGGWGLKEVSDDISGVLVTDAPRLFAPPMDPVLALDFLLSHFNGPEWNYVRNNEPRYKSVVQNSQARLWKPYFDAIKDLFDISARGGDSPHVHLLPNMI